MNTKAETLTQLEARGRLFATALLDAGFSASEVQDASAIIGVRSQCARRCADTVCLNLEGPMLLGTSQDARQTAVQENDTGHAFVAGVLAVIEERA